MSDLRGPILEAVEALKASRHEVETWGGGLFWLVDGRSMTDGEALALALRLGLMDSTTNKLQ
jgi:hypothetical protein